MVERPYHHGDLRQALIDAGLARLGGRTADDLSLREVARAVGVSATAVYRHFPDKGALLAALAREGLARLAAAQHVAAGEAGGGVAGFGASGRAYVRFALANPALFRLIFTNPPDRDPACGAAGELPEAMAFLRANAADAAGGDPAVAGVVTVQAWALVHGLAMLMLDGQVVADDAVIDAVVDAGLLGARGGRDPLASSLDRPYAPD